MRLRWIRRKMFISSIANNCPITSNFGYSFAHFSIRQYIVAIMYAHMSGTAQLRFGRMCLFCCSRTEIWLEFRVSPYKWAFSRTNEEEEPLATDQLSLFMVFTIHRRALRSGHKRAYTHKHRNIHVAHLSDPKCRMCSFSNSLRLAF